MPVLAALHPLIAAAGDLPAPLSNREVLLRLGAASLFGALVGFNRELHLKPAGIRTQALVSLGAATVTLVTADLVLESGQANVDAMSRSMQGVITGIGFLGAGAILRDRSGIQVHGLTTAASVWISAALGLACGAGLWRLAVIPLALAIGILWLLQPVEELIHRRQSAQTPPPPEP
jgi:putative Mg2+ transporter-C (MgtC) family protein